MKPWRPPPAHARRRGGAGRRRGERGEAGDWWTVGATSVQEDTGGPARCRCLPEGPRVAGLEEAWPGTRGPEPAPHLPLASRPPPPSFPGRLLLQVGGPSQGAVQAGRAPGKWRTGALVPVRSALLLAHPGRNNGGRAVPGAVGEGASEETIGRPWGEATSGPSLRRDPKGYVPCRSGTAGSPRARALLTIAEKDRKQRDLRLGGAAERGKLLSLLAGRPLPSFHHPVGSRGREGCGRKETQIPQ